MKKDSRLFKGLRIIGWGIAGCAACLAAVYIGMLLVFIFELNAPETAPAVNTAVKGHPLHENETSFHGKIDPDKEGPAASVKSKVPEAADEGGEIPSLHPLVRRYRLMGTSTGQDAPPKAFIMDSDSDTKKVLMQGDLLSGAKIEIIRDKEVFLTADNQLISLYLGEGMRQGTDPPKAKSYSVTLRKRELEYFITHAHAEGGQVTLYPVKNNDGHIQGVVINHIPPELLLTKMGVQNEDMVTAINGKRIASVRDFSLFLKDAIEQEPFVSFDVIRDGKTMNTGFEIY